MKKLLDFLKNPPVAFLIFIAVIALAAIVTGTLFLVPGGITGNVYLGFALLGIGGVAAAYFIYGVFRIKNEVKAKILKWAENHKFWNKLFHSYGFRTITFSIGSFAITTAFAVYNGAIALGMVFSPNVASTTAIWFGALAAYYLVLIILRGSILLYHTKRRKAVQSGQPETQTNMRDIKVYGKCGILLLLLPICLSFAVLQMVSEDVAFEHSGIMIYVYAIYAFYKIITSSINFIKAHKTDEMTVRASRNINLADALVSILALQTAMFREFNYGDTSLNSALMNAVTGAVVCALTVAIGIFMIVMANVKIKKLKNELND
ncbi:MAG: hypothetical protein K2K80_00485 [Clostridia bacterium]|nr:hypothetical protein [Clostridia bacterium]